MSTPPVVIPDNIVTLKELERLETTTKLIFDRSAELLGLIEAKKKEFLDEKDTDG